MDNSSLDELLERLEGSVVKLLESVRGDPWSLLIFQTLIWSFRRWAIHYLISEDMSDNMHDYIWESHIDLVREFAPEGLQELGVVWLSPANVGDRIDSLEELNAYFLLIVDKLNKAIDTDNDAEQNLLSIFLDETLTDIIGEWLEGRTEYRIYPTHEESSDTFSTERIFSIMQKILEKNARPRREEVVKSSEPIVLERLESSPPVYEPPPVEPVYVPPPVEPVYVPPPVEPVYEPPHVEPVYVPPPVEPVYVPPPVEPVYEPEPPAPEPPAPEPPAPPRPPPPSKPVYMTIAAAINRHRTMRLHGKRTAEETPNNKNKTRKRNRSTNAQ